MEEFRSLHLQKNLGEVLAAAEVAPTVLVNRGQPRIVVISAAEFRRLKQAANESVPRATLPGRPAVDPRNVQDPLGHDTSNLRAVAREMAEDALSGRNAEAVMTEMDRVRRRLGMRRDAVPSREAAGRCT